MSDQIQHFQLDRLSRLHQGGRTPRRSRTNTTPGVLPCPQKRSAFSRRPLVAPASSRRHDQGLRRPPPVDRPRRRRRGAWRRWRHFRVHHFARQLRSPLLPLLAAVGVKTSRIEIGTAVIDMRYENPLYMAEDAGAADIIPGEGGHLPSSASVAGRPEQVIDGWRYFGYAPPRGPERCRYEARHHAEVFLEVLRGQGFHTIPIHVPVFRTRQAFCVSSLIRRACVSVSGGAHRPTPPPSGPPSGNAPAKLDSQAR